MEKYSFLENECLLAATEISVCVIHAVKGFGLVNKAEIDVETVKDFILRASKITVGEGNGTPLQHSCLENPMDGGA